VTGRQGRSNRELLDDINPLNAELNPICHLVALLGNHHILHISRMRVNIYSTNVENWASS
jgi:hypothetical protein